jgi:hypothetical protein
MRHWEDREAAFSFGLELLEKEGLTPTGMSLRGEGYSGKMATFSRNRAKLKRLGFGPVTSWFIYAADENQRPASFGATYLERQVWCSFALPDDRVSRSGTVEDAGSRITELLGVEYGFVTNIPMQVGADLYPVGVSYAGYKQPYYLSVNNSEWGGVGLGKKLWQQGTIRRVYGLNLVGASVLHREIEGVTMREWIQRDSLRGTLTPGPGDLSAWRVPEDQCAELTLTLIKHRIAFYFRHHTAWAPPTSGGRRLT